MRSQSIRAHRQAGSHPAVSAAQTAAIAARQYKYAVDLNGGPEGAGERERMLTETRSLVRRVRETLLKVSDQASGEQQVALLVAAGHLENADWALRRTAPLSTGSAA